MAKYVLNTDEMAAALKALDGTEIDLTYNDESTGIIDEYLPLILELLQKLAKQPNNQCTVDFSKHIPAIVGEYTISKVFERDSHLTCMTFSQTGWKVEDTISLYVGDKCVIDNIHTKELGQVKSFAATYNVLPGEEVKIVYNNSSGNSKMFHCDINYLERR